MINIEEIFWEIIKKSGKNCCNIDKIKETYFKNNNMDDEIKNEVEKKFHHYYNDVWTKMEPIMGGIYKEDSSGFKNFVFYLLSKGKEKFERFLEVNSDKYVFKDFSKFNIEYRIKEKLFNKKSKYQLVQVFKTKEFGNMLVIDNDVQLTEADEKNYHEMIAHVPLAYFNKEIRVLIVGGGDGGTAREVLKHKNVIKCDMIDIDKVVIEAASTHFKDFATVFNHPTKHNNRFNLIIGDGCTYVKKYNPIKNGYYDLVIIDSTDFNQSVCLFSNEFYERLKKITTKKKSIICFNADNINWNERNIIDMYTIQKKMFKYVNPYTVYVPTFAGGFYSFCIVSDTINPMNNIIDWQFMKNKIKLDDFNLQYYNQGIHVSSFYLPNRLHQTLKIHRNEKTLGHHYMIDISDINLYHIDLEDIKKLKNIMEEVIRIGGMKILKSSFHKFEPQGHTGFYLLAESHLSFHTWPEKGIISIDLYTCGDIDKAFNATQYIITIFKSDNYKVNYVER